jgi:hypothetical protein
MCQDSLLTTRCSQPDIALPSGDEGKKSPYRFPIETRALVVWATGSFMTFKYRFNHTHMREAIDTQLFYHCGGHGSCRLQRHFVIEQSVLSFTRVR